VDEITSIEIPQLMALGDDVAEIGTRLARAASDIEGWRDSGAGAVEGSVTCEIQLGLLAGNWRSTLGLLARSIQDHGRSLHQAAADYRSADEAAARRIGQAGATAMAGIIAAGIPGAGPLEAGPLEAGPLEAGPLEAGKAAGGVVPR
jgi:hypothetical protein